MSDSLVIGVFRELAVLKGQRTPEGSWGETKLADFNMTLRQAMRIAKDAKTAVGSVGATDT